MNKERLGNFIGGERRSLGLTQKDLAARLAPRDGQGREPLGDGPGPAR